MRVRKSARKGVSGDCQRHHSHRQRMGNANAMPKGTLPYAVMRSVIPQSDFQPFMLYQQSNLAVQQEVIPEVKAEENSTPKLKLATDHGHDVRDDDANYQAWLELNTPIPNNVRQLFDESGGTVGKVIVQKVTPMIGNLPVPELTYAVSSVQDIPTRWLTAKERGLRASSHSQRERINNVHHTETARAERVANFVQSVSMQKKHAEPIINQPTADEVVPPWVAADVDIPEPLVITPEVSSDKAERRAALERKRQMMYFKKKRMRKKKFIRRAMKPVTQFYHKVVEQRLLRQQWRQTEHRLKSGFMDDVQNQRLGAAQYYERKKFVLGKGKNTEAGIPDNYVHHSAAMYQQRKAYRLFLKQHGETAPGRSGLLRPLTDLANSDSPRTAATPTVSVEMTPEMAYFKAAYAKYGMRDAVCQRDPEPEVHPDFNRTVTSDEIIRRAEMRIKQDDEAAFHAMEQYCYDSWLRSHAFRERSEFDTKFYWSVTRAVFPSVYKPSVYRYHQTQEWRAACERAGSRIVLESKWAEVHAPLAQECQDDLRLLTDGGTISKLIRSGQGTSKHVVSVINKVTQSFELAYDEERGLVLPQYHIHGKDVVMV